MSLSTPNLVEKIEALPEDKKAEVEDFVDFLRARTDASERITRRAGRIPPELLDRINERRETLRREHGLFDMLPLIREFRETGR